MKLEYQDYFITKPLCLIYWNLDSSFDIIQKYLKEDFEIREVKTLEDLISWFGIADVSVVIIGVKELKEINDLMNYLNEKLPIEKRRELFLIYVLPKVKTFNSKATFLLNANLIISEENISDFERIYKKAQQYWTSLYRDFKLFYEKLKEKY